MYDSLDVAAYIAQQCRAQNIAYNNTKIQKLLYIAYGVFLAKKGKKICKESPKAWPYGPVFPRVFKYIHNGNNIDIDMYSAILENELPQEEKDIFSAIVSFFGKYTAGQLSAWSHKENSPWDKAIKRENGAGWNVIIDDEDIIDYFKSYVLAK